jgi:hypothetical protein
MNYISDSERANLFGELLRETFVDNPNDNSFDFEFYHSVESANNFDNFEVVPFSIFDLDRAISLLKTKSAPGLDGTNNAMLKNLPFGAKCLLLNLINMSLRTKIPDEWKRSVITMIPKKDGMSNDPCQYRPISLTSCICKLAERMIKSRLYHFLESKNLFSVYQSGFRRHRGCADNLLNVTEMVKKNLLESKNVCGVFFDVAKAFDRVWHGGIIYKMKSLGIPSYIINFVKNFLADRSFTVKIQNSRSMLYPSNCGVPQGSVLGPLLFLIFINDIPLVGKKTVNLSVLYCDDLVALFPFRKPGLIVNEINKYLASLVAWLFKWRLKMNVEKCSFIIFSNKSYSNELFKLNLGTGLIPYSKTVKFLGITFDERLTFSQHFADVRIKCLKRLNIVKIFSHRSWKLNSKTLICIYRSLIESIIDYAFFTVSCLSKTTLYSFQTLQNRAVRIIFHLPFDSPTDQLYSYSNLLSIKTRMLQLNARYSFKSIIFNNALTLSTLHHYIANFCKHKKHQYESPFGFIITILLISFTYFHNLNTSVHVLAKPYECLSLD